MKPEQDYPGPDIDEIGIAYAPHTSKRSNPMEPWQQRVIDEKTELDARINRLRAVRAKMEGRPAPLTIEGEQ